MVKYTTALRLGTVQPEDSLRRFARSGRTPLTAPSTSWDGR